MTSFKKLYLLIGIAIFIFGVGCKSDANKAADNALEAIPSNATVVTAFDLPVLMKKANFEAVQQMDFYQFFAKKAAIESDILATVFANPENSGIDLTRNAYLSIELNPNNPEEFYTGAIFNLTSSEDFADFANSFKDAVLDNRTGYEIADINESISLAWNNHVGVIALGEGIQENPEVINSFFKPNTESKLSDNENLTALLAEQHDITTWLTSNALAKNKSAKLVLSLAKIDPEALNDNFIHGYLDFEQGKVDAQLNYFFQEKLVEDINLLFKENVKADFSSYISSDNLNIYLSAALDFNGLNTALSKRPQVKMFADFALKSYGLSIQKLKNALDGDFVFATYTGKVNNRQEGLFGIKLADPAEFEAFLALAEQKDLVTKTGLGRYLLAPTLPKMLANILPIEIGSPYDNQVIIHDGFAFISGNINRLDAIANGSVLPSNKTPTNIIKMVNENPLALFIDFNSLKRSGLPRIDALNLLEFSGNKKGADFQLGLKNESINSLQAIFEIINEEFLKDEMMKQEASQEKS